MLCMYSCPCSVENERVSNVLLLKVGRKNTQCNLRPKNVLLHCTAWTPECLTVTYSTCRDLCGGGTSYMNPVLLFCVLFLFTSSDITAWRGCGHRYLWYLDRCMFNRYSHGFRTPQQACTPARSTLSVASAILQPTKMLCRVQSQGM